MVWLTDGRTSGRTDGRTDGRTPYHNTSEVSPRAYNYAILYPLDLTTNLVYVASYAQSKYVHFTDLKETLLIHFYFTVYITQRNTQQKGIYLLT